MVVAVLFDGIFLGLNLGILGPGVDDSDGEKHVENKLVWNFNSNGKSRRNEFILTAKIVQAVDLQDFRRLQFWGEGDFFFVGVRINWWKFDEIWIIRLWYDDKWIDDLV